MPAEVGPDRTAGRRPRDYLLTGQTWPSGRLDPGTPLEVAIAAGFVGEIMTEMTTRQWDITTLARTAGADVGELTSVIEGLSLPGFHLASRVSTELGIGARFPWTDR